jgi:hypothetical protein
LESMPKVSELRWKDMEAATEAALTAAQERCTMPPALSAERHVKFPSSPMAPGRCTAAIATRSISLPDRPEDTNHVMGTKWARVDQLTLQSLFFLNVTMIRLRSQ